jgi:hypothetical protein
MSTNKSLDEIVAAQKTRLKLRPELPKKLSNMDRLHHMMTFSEHGALAQVFIMEAIRHYSATIRSVEPPENDLDDHGFISKRRWWEISVDINKEINQHLNIKED